MIRSIRRTTQFKRDYKKMIKQGRDMEALTAVIAKLFRQEMLEPKYRDHQLSGNLRDFRDCHIGPDWLLLYQYDGDELVLSRTGTHSELYG